MDRSKVDWFGGFSQVRVILSDALPSAAFHPDFERSIREKNGELPMRFDKPQEDK